jgi:serine O-acetyltransferase
MGFDAYGATRDAPDPVAHAINCMLDHIHLVDRRMHAMSEALRKAGVDVPGAELPEIEASEVLSIDEGAAARAADAGGAGAAGAQSPHDGRS